MRSAKTKRKSIPIASPPRPATIVWGSRRVDRVKIRKKAKEKKEKGEKGVPGGAPVSEQVERPATSPGDDRRVTGRSTTATTTTDKLEQFLAHAGERRETNVPKEQVAVTQREVLTFVIDREHYAVDIER